MISWGDYQRRRTPCQLDFHSWDLIMPIGEPVQHAKCSQCGLRVSVEVASRNIEWQDKQRASK